MAEHHPSLFPADKHDSPALGRMTTLKPETYQSPPACAMMYACKQAPAQLTPQDQELKMQRHSPKARNSRCRTTPAACSIRPMRPQWLIMRTQHHAMPPLSFRTGAANVCPSNVQNQGVLMPNQFRQKGLHKPAACHGPHNVYAAATPTSARRSECPQSSSFQGLTVASELAPARA